MQRREKQPQRAENPRIFISYRRADSEHIVGRIYDRLVNEFGPSYVFKDVENIPPGRDFREILGKAVQQADVLLIVIGPDWLDIRGDDGRRRLDAPNDYVRFEIESALGRDDVLMIPLLVKGANNPPADELPPSIEKIAYFNSLPVRGDPDFNRDVGFLIKYLREEPGRYLRRNLEISQGLRTDALQEPRQQPATPAAATKASNSRLTNYAVAIMIAVVLVCLGLAGIGALIDSSDNGDDGTAITVGSQGFLVEATYPDGWEGATQTGNIILGSNSAILTEATNRNIVTELTLAAPAVINDYRLSSSGTLVGIAVITDATFSGLSGAEYASYNAEVYNGFGLAASASTVSNGRWSGGRLRYGAAGYSREFHFYDVSAGLYLRVFILSDRYNADSSAIEDIISNIRIN